MNDYQIEDRGSHWGLWSIIALILIVVAIIFSLFRSNDPILAVVNGESINSSLVKSRVKSAQTLLMSNGLDVSKLEYESMMKEATDQVIDEVLIVQAFDSEGILITEQEIEVEIEDLKSSFSNEKLFQDELRNRGIRPGNLNEDIEKYLKIEKYLGAKTEQIFVTDDEVLSYYNSLIKDDLTPPNFENVKQNLSDMLVEKKIEAQIVSILEELRAKAEINIL